MYIDLHGLPTFLPTHSALVMCLCFTTDIVHLLSTSCPCTGNEQAGGKRLAACSKFPSLVQPQLLKMHRNMSFTILTGQTSIQKHVSLPRSSVRNHLTGLNSVVINIRTRERWTPMLLFWRYTFSWYYRCLEIYRYAL